MKLELGSGYAPTPGYLHLDANPHAPDVDFVGLAHPLPEIVRERPWDEIRAVDVLEHISYRDTDDALAGWAEVLRRGGTLFVQVPDADTIMREYVTRAEKDKPWDADGYIVPALLGAAWRLLGGHDDGTFVKAGDDWRLNAHYSLWSERTLSAALQRAGLQPRLIERNEHPNLRAWSLKP